jgi:predicted nuclease of predicted toxin-antitoxin system
MRFVVDEDVPKSAADFLVERNHEVIHVAELLLPSSDDFLIARWAHENTAIVVTCNLRHFRPLLKRPRHQQAGLLGLTQVLSRRRLEQFIELVEAEGELEGGHFWLEIRDTTALLGR